MSNDWLRQRKEITVRPREEAEASKDSDKQINRKRKKLLEKKKKFLSTWKALAETVGEIKREKGKTQSALLVIGEAGRMEAGGSEGERKAMKENEQ